MIKPVIFGPTEMALTDHLAAALVARGDNTPVVNGVPRNRPSRYVLVVRVGGLKENLITDAPRIVAECCDQNGPAAAELAATVRALIGACAPGYIGDIWVDKVIDRGLVFSPDPDTNLPRYLVTADLYVTGTALA